MTITKRPPGLWFVECDECGDRVELDTDPDDSIVEAVADVKALGWRVNPPIRGARGGSTWTHNCGDCR